MADDTEMRAINERLVIAGVQQQEIAEAATRSAALYRLLARNFPDGAVFLFDRDLRHVLATGKGFDMLGLSPEPLGCGAAWQILCPQDVRLVEEAYRAALAGETTTLEVQLRAEVPPAEGGESVYRIQTLPAPDDRGEIQTGMAVAQDVTEQRRAEEAVRWRAYHDPLTGLPNRALLHDRLDQVLARAERLGEMAALLFVDLDGFKRVNDAWGHAAGDRLLEAVAARLTGGLRAEDTVARLGGDEFVVLLPGLQAAGDAATVARKLRFLLAAPFPVAGQEVSVTASVGISVFPADGRDAATLMKSADDAMYQFKRDRHGAPDSDAGSWPDTGSWPDGGSSPEGGAWYA